MTAPAGSAGEVPQVELRRPSHAEDITPEECAGSLGTTRRLQTGGKDCTILPAALELAVVGGAGLATVVDPGEVYGE